MKKLLSILLAALMALAGTVAMAEQAAGAPDDELVVGSTTALSGSFFTEMWGDNTSDIDVRMLLHGYNLIQWNGERGSYGIDPTVVTGISAADDPRGNRTYTITLSGGLTYSDGAPITARDYAFSMLLAASPEVGDWRRDGSRPTPSLAWRTTRAATASALRRARAGRLFAGRHRVRRVPPFFYELAHPGLLPVSDRRNRPGCEVADDGDGRVHPQHRFDRREPIFTADCSMRPSSTRNRLSVASVGRQRPLCAGELRLGDPHGGV